MFDFKIVIQELTHNGVLAFKKSRFEVRQEHINTRMLQKYTYENWPLAWDLSDLVDEYTWYPGVDETFIDEVAVSSAFTNVGERTSSEYTNLGIQLDIDHPNLPTNYEYFSSV